MGNKASVLPNESDGVPKSTKQPKAQQRRKQSYQEAAPTPKAPRPRRSTDSRSMPKATDVDTKALKTTKPSEVASTPKITDLVPDKVVDSRADARTTESGSARRGDTTKADSGLDRRNSQDDSGPPQNGKCQKTGVGQGRKRSSGNHQERKAARGSGEYHANARRGGSREDTASEEQTSGSGGSGSYTSSSYSSGSEESDEDGASDDTFYVPNVSLVNAPLCQVSVLLSTRFSGSLGTCASKWT